jgi:hypothetical protein
MVRRPVRVLLALVFVLALGVTWSTPSSADSCFAGKICIYESTNFGGIQLNIGGTAGSISNKLGHTVLEDNNNSAVNATTHAIKIFDELNAKGTFICLTSGQSIADLGGAGFTDGSSTKILKRKFC